MSTLEETIERTRIACQNHFNDEIQVLEKTIFDDVNYLDALGSVQPPWYAITEDLKTPSKQKNKESSPHFYRMLTAALFTKYCIDDNYADEKRRASFRLGAAVEMLHVASLVIDDIQDNSETRRNAPAVHKRYNPHQAILLTRALENQARDSIEGAYLELIANHQIEPQSIVRRKAYTRRCANLMLWSQGLDISDILSSLKNVNEPERRKIMQSKTQGKNYLFKYATELIESLVTPNCEKPLAIIGKQLALGHQIRDDLVDHATLSSDSAEKQTNIVAVLGEKQSQKLRKEAYDVAVRHIGLLDTRSEARDALSLLTQQIMYGADKVA